MAEEKISILLSDVSVEGDLVEKDKIILDAKVSGDIKADDIETHANSNIKGNIKSKTASIGGKLRGNIRAQYAKPGGSLPRRRSCCRALQIERSSGR